MTTYDPVNLPAEKFSSMFNVNYENSQLRSVICDLPFDKAIIGIAGGALVRHLTKEDIFKGDIDIWACDSPSFNVVLEQFKTQSSFSETKFSYNVDYRQGVRKTKLQLIKNPIEGLPTVIGCFDFHHCKFAIYNGAHSQLILSTPEAIATLAARKIKCSNITDAAYSLGRALRYKKRGYDADQAIDVLGGMICKKQEKRNFDSFKETDYKKFVASTIGKS